MRRPFRGKKDPGKALTLLCSGATVFKNTEGGRKGEKTGQTLENMESALERTHQQARTKKKFHHYRRAIKKKAVVKRDNQAEGRNDDGPADLQSVEEDSLQAAKKRRGIEGNTKTGVRANGHQAEPF